MIKRLFTAAILVLSALATDVQAQCTFGSNEQAAAPWFTSVEAGAPPNVTIVQPGISRRFVGNALTWRIVGSSSPTVTARRQLTMDTVAYILNSATSCNAGVTVTQVASSTPAHITFRYGTSGLVYVWINGVPSTINKTISSGQLASIVTTDLYTYNSADIISHSSGDSLYLHLHEVLGHLFGVQWHTQTSGNQLVGLSSKNSGLCQVAQNWTPAQIAASCEPTPGYWKVAAAIYTLPAGSPIP